MNSIDSIGSVELIRMNIIALHIKYFIHNMHYILCHTFFSFHNFHLMCQIKIEPSIYKLISKRQGTLFAFKCPN